MTEMSTAFLCPQDNLLSSFNDPCLFSLHPRDHLSTPKEVLFGILWDLSAQPWRVLRMLWRPHVSPLFLLQVGTETWLSLVALQSQCICFNMFLIDVSCYNILFINLQETVNATGEANCKLFCDKDAIKRSHCGKLTVNFKQDSYVATKEHLFLLLPTWLLH